LGIGDSDTGGEQEVPTPPLAVSADERVHLQEPRGDAGAALADLQVDGDAVEADWLGSEQQVAVQARGGLGHTPRDQEASHVIDEAALGLRQRCLVRPMRCLQSGLSDGASFSLYQLLNWLAEDDAYVCSVHREEQQLPKRDEPRIRLTVGPEPSRQRQRPRQASRLRTYLAWVWMNFLRGGT